MSDIWFWLALKLKMEIPSRQRTITNTLNTTTDRCSPARAEIQGLRGVYGCRSGPTRSCPCCCEHGRARAQPRRRTCDLLREADAAETCPACGSNRLEPQRGTHPKVPGVEFERPTCAKCGWAGEPVSILADPQAMLTTRSKRRRRMSPGGRWSSLSCPRCRCGSLSNRGETTNKGNEQRNPQRLERPVGNAGIGVEGK
jgi:hypothetical protein